MPGRELEKAAGNNGKRYGYNTLMRDERNSKTSAYTRIVLLGSESTGKTTLAQALAGHFGVKMVPEFLREYFIANNGRLTFEDALPIARGQLAMESAAEAYEAGCKKSMQRLYRDRIVMIYDTNVVSSVVYNKYYYGKNPDEIFAMLNNRQYDYYLLCDVDVPWEADGQRDRPDDREVLQRMFVQELEEHNFPYSVVRGSVEERFAMSLEYITHLV